MKMISKGISLVLVLISFEFAQNPAFAQPQPVILRLRGGVSMADAGSDVQIAGTYAFVTHFPADTNDPGGLEIFSLTNPAAPVRVGGYQSSEGANAVQVPAATLTLAKEQSAQSRTTPELLKLST